MAELHELTAAIYLAASLSAVLGVALPASRLGRLAGLLLALGAATHGLAFIALHTHGVPPPLTDLFSAGSLMAWIAVLFCLALLRHGRFVGLVALVAPPACVAVVLAGFSPSHATATPIEVAGSWPHLHVILASAGLGLFAVAGLAGLLFLAEEGRLKAKRPLPWGLRLPSLESLDWVNGVALALGFPLLTLGVATGMLWDRSVTGSFWAGGLHETWSAVAWAIYGALAVARFGAGWRGREAALSAALGFAVLLFAVVGAELVA